VHAKFAEKRHVHVYNSVQNKQNPVLKEMTCAAFQSTHRFVLFPRTTAHMFFIDDNFICSSTTLVHARCQRNGEIHVLAQKCFQSEVRPIMTSIGLIF
jgi:hypothetical protein